MIRYSFHIRFPRLLDWSMQEATLGLLREVLLMGNLRAALEIGLAARVKVPWYFKGTLPRLRLA